MKKILLISLLIWVIISTISSIDEEGKLYPNKMEYALITNEMLLQPQFSPISGEIYFVQPYSMGEYHYIKRFHVRYPHWDYRIDSMVHVTHNGEYIEQGCK